MHKKMLALGILLIGLLALPGCTDLNKMDLSCEIPLTPFFDKPGRSISIVSDSVVDQEENQPILWHAVTVSRSYRPSTFIGAKPVRQPFTVGGLRYTLVFAVGHSPVIYDAYGGVVPVAIEHHEEIGNWDSSVDCDLGSVGDSAGCEERYTLTFNLPGLDRVCEVSTSSWAQIEIKEEKSWYVDSNGTTVYYDYAVAVRKWGVSASVGVRHYLKGSARFAGDDGDLTLEATVADADLDGMISDRDRVQIRAYTKGGTVGGPVGDSLPFNSLIPVTSEYGYILTLKTVPGPDVRYTLVIERQER